MKTLKRETICRKKLFSMGKVDSGKMPFLDAANGPATVQNSRVTPCPNQENYEGKNFVKVIFFSRLINDSPNLIFA